MDQRGLPMYQHPRMTMMGQSDINSVPESIPINYQINNSDVGSMGMQGVPMSENHASYPQKTQHHNQIASHSEQHYDHGRIHDGVLHKTTTHNSTEENGAAHIPTKEHEDDIQLRNEINDPDYLPPGEQNDGQLQVPEEKIKTEQEDQDEIDNFMQTAHDIFLRVSSKELKIEEASQLLERPYSFVYSRYQEWCDNITGKVPEKKKKSSSKKKGKVRKKPKRLTSGKAARDSRKIYYCEDCPASFKTEYLIKAHSKMHTDNKESHLCTACGIVFPKMGQLMNHRIEAHGDALQCPHCEDQFTVVKSYRDHIRAHSKPTFKCKECGKGFFSKYTLRDHQRMHSGERPFMCGHCEKTFTTIGNLKSHQYVHTGWPERPKTFKCQECGKLYDSNYKLEQHMISHTGARPHQCDLCDARFNLKANLARHRVKHTGEKPFQCNYCPMAFAFETDLKRHDMAHTGNKPFKCTFCDYSCVRKNLLEYHMNTHTGERPYKCDFYGCSAEYSGLSTLKKHKLKHGPPPLKTCKVCGENFTDMNSLKCHMMIHPGHKPLPCDQCDKIFYNESTLKRHMHVHMYKPDGAKPKTIVRKRAKNPQMKKPAKPPVNSMPMNLQKPLTSEYLIPATSGNAHSSLAHSWTINAEDTSSQHSMTSQPLTSHPLTSQSLTSQSFTSQSLTSQALTSQSLTSQSLHHPFPPSQLTNLNAWPSTMDPDELRRRLLTSFN